MSKESKKKNVLSIGRVISWFRENISKYSNRVVIFCFNYHHHNHGSLLSFIFYRSTSKCINFLRYVASYGIIYLLCVFYTSFSTLHGDDTSIIRVQPYRIYFCTRVHNLQRASYVDSHTRSFQRFYQSVDGTGTRVPCCSQWSFDLFRSNVFHFLYQISPKTTT